MDKMLSCDWGTSFFRLRLVNSSDLSILGTRTTAQGIVSTHALWAGQPGRLSFYQTILRDAITSIGQELGLSLDGLPLIISGMASSSLGMMELPYKELPFSAEGSDLRVETLAACASFNHDTLLISGVRTENDVMRGEETQLVGCDRDPGAAGPGDRSPGGERIFIFPGTHSKHVLVRKNRAIDLKTYMTGEFFALLSRKSILAGDVEDNEADGATASGGGIRDISGEGKGIVDGGRMDRFEEGVREGARDNLLHSSFLIRTNRLLRGISKEENYHYLSGLLIGAELKELAGKGASITLVSDGVLKDHYVAALRILGMDGIGVRDGGEAVLRGQWKIAGAAGMKF